MVETQSFDPDRPTVDREGFPPGTLILHSPWMTNTDLNGDQRYVGTLQDPRLISCTYVNELDGKVPTVIDRFISFCKPGEGFWDEGSGSGDVGLSDEPTFIHRHNLDHSHVQANVGMTTNGSGEVDDDDGGERAFPAAAQHFHDVTLDEVRMSVTENIPGTDGEGYPPHNPVHYEVSAYHVDPTQEEYVFVPAGTLVFARYVSTALSDDVGGYPGWQRLDETPLKRDRRETDPSYQPKPWKNVALKVSGCIPSKTPKGRRRHTHDTPSHFHLSGKADGSPATTRVDPLGNFQPSYPSHTHDVAETSEVYQQIELAENLRRHMKLACFIAVGPRAPLFKGMMVPFVPRRGTDDVLRATSDGQWTLFTQETSESGDPVLSLVRDVGDFRQYDPDEAFSVKGKNEHFHHYDHHHIVRLSHAIPERSRETRLDDNDDDLVVATRGHTHGHFVMTDPVKSSPSINPLQYRRVFFIERLVDE